MSKVKLIVNRSIQHNGTTYTPKDDSFHLPEDLADRCEERGLIKILDTEAVPTIKDLKSVTATMRGALIEAGFATIEDVANATAEELTIADGIGEKRAAAILEEATALVNG